MMEWLQLLLPAWIMGTLLVFLTAGLLWLSWEGGRAQRVYSATRAQKKRDEPHRGVVILPVCIQYR